MAGADVVAERAVLVDGDVGVDEDVNVGGTAGVVAGEDGVEHGHAVLVCLLDAAEEGLVNVARVAGVTVAVGHHARVDTRGVAVPHLKVDVGNGLARVYVDDLVVDGGGDTLLVIDDVLADVLATHVVRSLGDIGGEDTAGVAAEQGACVRVGSVAEARLVVVGGEDAVECSLALETALDPGCLDRLLTTSDVSCLDTASLEFGAAVAEITNLGGGHVVAAFLDFFGNRVARVGSGHARQKSAEDGRCELHFVCWK